MNGLNAKILSLLTRLVKPAEVCPISLVQWKMGIDARYADKARSTRLRMAQAVRELIGLAGQGATTAELTPGLIARFAASHPERRPATTDGLLRAARAACNWAILDGTLGPSPFDGHAYWRSSKADRPLKSRHHSRADVAKVLERLRRGAGSWEGGRLHALGSLVAYCGLRKMEALRLRAEDVDLAEGVIRVARRSRLKTEASADVVPIPSALAPILRDWLGRCGSGWVFPGVKRLGPWIGGKAGSRPLDCLQREAKAAGVEGLTFHRLRHSLATHLRGHWGLSGKQVQAVLRHSDQATQELYCHEDRVNLVESVRGFDYLPKPRPRPSPRRVLPLRRLKPSPSICV